MNLTSVKYQDSCIYIGLDGSQGQKFVGEFLERIKNVYVVYKIKAHDNYVRDTILIRKKDIVTVRGEIIVKFELSQLHRPDECEIEIVSLKFIYLGGKRDELEVNQSYPFLEIRAHPPIFAPKRRSSKTIKIVRKAEKSALSMTQEIIVHPLRTLETAKSIEVTPLMEEKEGYDRDLDYNFQEKVTVIDNKTPLSTVVSEVELKVERKLDAQTKKLELDINQLCYETVDLLLTSLPHPELAEEYRASDVMVRSIHRYINADLLQKELGEGESA